LENVALSKGERSVDNRRGRCIRGGGEEEEGEEEKEKVKEVEEEVERRGVGPLLKGNHHLEHFDFSQ